MAAPLLQPIDCSVQPLDLAFHPSKDILAAALVDGTVECKCHHDVITPPLLESVRANQKSCFFFISLKFMIFPQN